MDDKLRDFKEVYDAELKHYEYHYEYSDSLIQTLLSHSEVRAFVYKVCKNLIAKVEEIRTWEGR